MMTSWKKVDTRDNYLGKTTSYFQDVVILREKNIWGREPQGSKIGPIAFLAVMNDAKPTSAEISQYKYVDDITLFFPFDKLD